MIVWYFVGIQVTGKNENKFAGSFTDEVCITAQPPVGVNSIFDAVLLYMYQGTKQSDVETTQISHDVEVYTWLYTTVMSLQYMFSIVL